MMRKVADFGLSPSSIRHIIDYRNDVLRSPNIITNDKTPCVHKPGAILRSLNHLILVRDISMRGKQVRIIFDNQPGCVCTIYIGRSLADHLGTRDADMILTFSVDEEVLKCSGILNDDHCGYVFQHRIQEFLSSFEFSFRTVTIRYVFMSRYPPSVG